MVERVKYDQYGRQTLFYTKKGLKFVSLDEDPYAEFQEWFGPTTFERGEHQFKYIVDAYEQGLDLGDVPLDIQGTDFQLKVWQALRRVKYGETTTYKKLANQIGRPAAVRAVASAVAKNPILIYVGCHRVLRTDGQIGDYRAGRDWKKQLLALEQHAEN